MKALSVIEQVNACLKHGNRTGMKINHFEFQPRGGDNHQVVACGEEDPNEGGIPFWSVAILINMRNGSFQNGCNESTWGVGRN